MRFKSILKGLMIPISLWQIFASMDTYGQSFTLTAAANCAPARLTIDRPPCTPVDSIIWQLNGVTAFIAYPYAYSPVAYDTNGVLVAGDTVTGSALNQFNAHNAYVDTKMHIDDTGNIYIADAGNPWMGGANERVVKWAPGATQGAIVAGGNGPGQDDNQFAQLSAVSVDGDANVFAVSRGTDKAMKWAPDASTGVVVAGGNGSGIAPDQLEMPIAIQVDEEGAIYIANSKTVVKWLPGATEGAIVAGTGAAGSGLDQLFNVYDLWVDQAKNVYVADAGNSRIMKWAPGATEGIVVASGSYYEAGFGGSSGSVVQVDACGYVYALHSRADNASSKGIMRWGPGVVGNSSNFELVVGSTSYAPEDYTIPKINRPTDFFIDKSGYLYVIDANRRVLKFTPESTVPVTDNVFEAEIGGSYTAIVYSNGTADTTNAVIVGGGVAGVTINPSGDAALCSNDSLIVTAEAWAAGLNYQWQENGTPISDATDSFYVVTDAGSYHVVVTDDSSCTSASDTLMVTLLQAPEQPVITVDNHELSTGFGLSGYQWSLNGNPIPGATSNSWTAVENGVYTVTVTADNGCNATSDPVSIDNITGIATTALAAQIRLYPNPVSDRLIIDAPIPVNAGISDIYGKHLLSIQRVREIDMEALASGIYMIRIEDQEGRLIKVEKLVKH